MATPLQRVRRIVPIAALALIVVAFAIGLTRDPSRIPTTLLDVEPPAFDLAPIEGYERGLSSADLRGQVSLVNIFASWCIPCAQEHPNLMAIKEMGGPPIYGVAWKDSGATTAWLARRGDPYAAVGDDADGRVGIDFGITGAPETFLIDSEGRVRYRHVGVITARDWREVFEPLIAQLEAE